MDLQQVTATPARPLASLAEDYGAAVLHLAWSLDRRSGSRTLLFACVDLLPHELPPPFDDGPQVFSLDSAGNRMLHVRHAIGTAGAALAWYLRARRGEAAALLHGEDDEQDAAIAPEGSTLLETALLGEEPVWPSLVCVTEGVPFTPAGSDGTRAHHLVPLAPVEPSALWPDVSRDEREAAMEWLSHRLHFSLERYPEYLGSAHLLAANPVVREVDSRLHREGPPDESVLFRMTPRYGKSLDGLTLSVSLSRPTGEQHTQSMRVQAPLIEMNVSGGIDRIGHTLADERRGVLSIHPPAWFMRSIRTGIDVPRSAVRASMARATGLQSGVEEAPAQRAASRLLQAKTARRERLATQSQLLLPGNLEAMTAVQSLLLRASREIFLVGSRFGARELSLFAATTTRSSVSFRILVSPPPGADTEPESQRLSALAAHLEKAAAEGVEVPSARTIPVRLTNERAPWGNGSLFLIDNTAWLLSGQMSDIGSHPMVLVQLPVPADVKDAVTRAFEAGVPLDAWLQAHVPEAQLAAQ